MKSFCNKGIWQKIIIIILLLIFFQTILVTPVHAVPGDVLLEPITGLFANLGDGIMEIMQKTFFDVETSGAWVEESDEPFWGKIVLIAGAVILAVVSFAAVIYSGGLALSVITTALGAVVKISAVTFIIYHVQGKLHLGEERILFTRILFDTGGDF